MRQKIHLYKLVNRSINQSKNWISILLSAFFCASLLFAIVVFFFFNLQLKETQAHNMFGSYQFLVARITLEDALRIKESPYVAHATIYSSESEQQKDGFVETIYASEDFLELSNYKLVSGVFPTGKEEVLCESWVLFHFGLSESDFIGAEILVEGVSHKVSGVIKLNQTATIEGFLCKTFIKNGKNIASDNVNILVQTDNKNYDSNLETIQETFNIENKRIYPNQNYLSYVAVDSRGIPSGFEATVYSTIAVLLFMLSVMICGAFSGIVGHQIQKSTALLRVQGVKKAAIIIVFLLRQSGLLLLSLFVATSVNYCGFLIASNVIFDYDDIKFPVMPIVITGLLLFFSLLSVNTVMIIAKSFKNLYSSVFNAFKIRNNLVEAKRQPEKSILSKKNLFWSIAKNNRKVTPRRNFLFSALLALCMILFSVILYATINIYEQNLYEERFDFKIDFIYKNYPDKFFGTPAHQNTYDIIANQKGLFVAFPIFSHSQYIKVSKKDITDDHKRYLCASSAEFVIKFDNKTLESIDIPITFIGLTDGQIETIFDGDNDMRIDEDIGVFLQRTFTSSGKGYDVGFAVGNSLSFESQVDQKNISLKLADSVGDLNTTAYNEIDTPIIFVNINTFFKINRLQYPETVFLETKSQHHAEVISFFRGNDTVKLIDLEEENSYLKEQWVFLSLSLVALVVLLCIFVSMNICILIFAKYTLSKKQYTSLYYNGISRRNIRKVFLYETIQIVIAALTWAVTIAIPLTYILYRLIVNAFGYYDYGLPYMIVLCSVIVVTMSVLISYSAVNKKILGQVNQ